MLETVLLCSTVGINTKASERNQNEAGFCPLASVHHCMPSKCAKELTLADVWSMEKVMLTWKDGMPDGN